MSWLRVIGLLISFFIGMRGFNGSLAGALAQPSAVRSEDRVQQRVRMLMRESQQALAGGNYDIAIQLLDEAYEIFPHPLLQYNLGQAHHRARHYAEAAQYYRLYLATQPLGMEAEQARLWLAQADRQIEFSAARSPEHRSFVRKHFVLIALGTSRMLGEGETEEKRNTVECCFAAVEHMHLVGEVGLQINTRAMVSFAARVGFPFGRNIAGGRGYGVAGLARFRYDIGSLGGFHVVGGIGGGVVRAAVELEGPNVDTSMNVDVFVVGPLLVSGGVGYLAPVTDGLAISAEVGGMAGMPIVDSIGASAVNFGVQLELKVGLMLRF